MGISWTKAQRDLAKVRGLGLYAYGFDTKAGRWEQAGLMDHDLAVALFAFVNDVYRGRDPAAAFAAVAWPGPNRVEPDPGQGPGGPAEGVG